jgi:hypothetical protein
MQPYSLDNLYTTFSKITKEVILFLPRTSDLNQIAKYNDKDEKIQAIHYCTDGASKVRVLLCLLLNVAHAYRRFVHIMGVSHQFLADVVSHSGEVEEGIPKLMSENKISLMCRYARRSTHLGLWQK